jgi:hypothetical protein
MWQQLIRVANSLRIHAAVVRSSITRVGAVVTVAWGRLLRSTGDFSSPLDGAAGFETVFRHKFFRLTFTQGRFQNCFRGNARLRALPHELQGGFEHGYDRIVESTRMGSALGLLYEFKSPSLLPSAYPLQLSCMKYGVRRASPQHRVTDPLPAGGTRALTSIAAPDMSASGPYR